MSAEAPSKRTRRKYLKPDEEHADYVTTTGRKYKKKPGPREFKPTKELIKDIKKWSANGLFDKHIAALIGVTHQTFIEYKKKFPEIIEAIDAGAAEAGLAVAEKLREQADLGNHQAQKFFLKYRMGWWKYGRSLESDRGGSPEASKVVTEQVSAALGELEGEA